jgi:hypothetical protein
MKFVGNEALTLLRVTRKLSSHQPHCPTGDDHAANEHHKTIQAVAEHIARGVTVRDTEDDGRNERKNQSRAEVSELNGHYFFPVIVSFQSLFLSSHCFFPMAM